MVKDHSDNKKGNPLPPHPVVNMWLEREINECDHQAESMSGHYTSEIHLTL